MNRKDASMIAETITNEQIQTMFDNAKSVIKDWRGASIVKKGLTKWDAWYILASDFDLNKSYNIMEKQDMVREFGEYLPANLKPDKKPNRGCTQTHQEPKF